ncbi:putative glutathione transferase [Medicago truncatula]|uniref:Putative glutathione transferase n=1 Tax=Medicago truncatula TaxID=3880 RepID=A0A396JI33_MEDTR|nr:putative glutathione transferase [Medicago truncatula]
METECPKLMAWTKRCMERDSVSKALPDFIVSIKKALGLYVNLMTIESFRKKKALVKKLLKKQLCFSKNVNLMTIESFSKKNLNINDQHA